MQSSNFVLNQPLQRSMPECPHCQGHVPDIALTSLAQACHYIQLADQAEEGSMMWRNFINLAIKDIDNVLQQGDDNIYAYYLKAKCLRHVDPQATIEIIDKAFEIQERHDVTLDDSSKSQVVTGAGCSCENLYQLEIYNGDAYMALNRCNEAYQIYKHVFDKATKDSNPRMQTHAAFHMSMAVNEFEGYDKVPQLMHG